MQLAELKPGLTLVGLEPELVCTVIAVTGVGQGAVQVVYRLPDGSFKERLLSEAEEGTVSCATSERPWSFDGDGAAFQLTCEAKRIDLAFLFDPMMAVHTSNVEPLPHQITAVYESMLSRQPLRYVLADDPGAGKTIMAGLYIRELIMRADARRILIVAPGSLVEQWRDELFEKFGLEFRIYSSLLETTSPSGNPFDDHHHLIVRLDQMARNEELQEQLCNAGWDLAVFDEAHKLAAHYFGSKLEKTGRFRFAERLGEHTRHLLLMTATPHNGKEEDFQLFLSLLDSDRFYGKFRDGVHKVDASDLMRRMVKEELVKFDGTPLFPERKAYTVNYALSDTRGGALRGRHRVREDGDGKGGPAPGLSQGLGRLRPHGPPASACLEPRGHLPVAQTPQRAARTPPAGGEARASVAARPWPRRWPPCPEDDDDLNAEEQENSRRDPGRRRDRVTDHQRARSGDRDPQGARTAGQGRCRLGAGPQVGGTLEVPPERPRDA